MADLRILVAVALNASDLSASDLRETAIDRIGALAFADPLGAELWALKWANRAAAYEPAVDLLSRRSKRASRDSGMRRKLCRMVLDEWLWDICLSCMGRGVRVATALAPVRHCEACDGSGKRQPSEVGRAREVGLDPKAWRSWQPALVMIAHRLTYAEDRAWVDIATQLGRIGIDDFRKGLFNPFRRLPSGVV